MSKMLFCFLCIVLLVTGCGGGAKENNNVIVTDESSKDSVTIVRSAALKSVDECSAGGVAIDAGIDANGNGTLDDNEVTSTKIVCNGEAGFTSLVAISDELVGNNCAAGGKKISVGKDVNRNSLLDIDEIENTQYICNGSNGVNGSKGIDGVDGVNGAAGASTVCSVKDNLDGTKKLSCNDGSSVIITDGAEGAIGPAGTSCSAVDNGNGKKTISCTDGSSITVSDGAAGAAGPMGPAGPSGASTICSVKDNLDGTKTLSCNDGSGVTISDGATGATGATGTAGSSCSVSDNGNGTNTISCTDGSSVTLNDGGTSSVGASCAIKDNGNGTKTISCGTGESITVKHDKAILKANLQPVVFSGDTARLDASLSTEGGIDGPFVSYQWRQIGSANTVKVAVTNPTSEVASFIAPTVTANTAVGFRLTAVTAQGSKHVVNLYAMIKPYAGKRVTNISKDFPNRKLGSLLGQSAVNDVVVIGNTAYVATNGSNGFQIIDISNSKAPVNIGNVATPGRAMGIAVDNSIAYITFEDGDIKSGLLEVNVSNPKAPKVLRTLSGSDRSMAGRVEVLAGKVYIASSFDGVLVIDLADPSVPSFIDTPGRAMDISIVNNIAYVTDREEGLRVIDLGDPTSAFNIKTPGGIATDVAVVGSLAYVIDLEGLQIVDLDSRQLLHSVNTPGQAQAITLANAIAYISYSEAGAESEMSGIQMVDLQGVSFGLFPVTLGYVNKVSGVIQDMAIVNGAGVVATNNSGLQLVDVTEVQPPVNLSSIGIDKRVFTVNVVDSIAYVSYMILQADDSRKYGLQLIDVTDPLALKVLSEVDAPKQITSVSVVSSVAYLGIDQGLQLIDVSNPEVPHIIRNIITPGDVTGVNQEPGRLTQGHVFDVEVINNVAYVAYVADGPLGLDGSGGSGVQLIDLANVRIGRTPVVLSTFELPAEARLKALAVSGSVVYLADQLQRVHMIDVSNKQAPKLIKSISIPGDVNSVVVEGDVAYVTYATQERGSEIIDSKLYAIDVTDVQSPVVKGNLGLPGYIYSGVVVGTTAYVAGVWDGLHIIDVSDAAAPRLLNSVNGPAFNPVDVTIIGNTVFIANLDEGLTSSQLPWVVSSHEFGKVNESLAYSIHLEVISNILSPAGRCWVSGGSCKLETIDSATNTANFSWQLPATAGDYEIVFGIGSKDFFLTNRDHVTVLNNALAKTLAGVWKETASDSFVSTRPDFLNVASDFKVTYYDNNVSGCSSQQGSLTDLTMSNLNQQSATDGNRRFVLASEDSLLMINAAVGVVTYTRVNAVEAPCL